MLETKCTHPPECRAQREVEVGREDRFATREMALDAGDPALEGVLVESCEVLETFEFCDKCGEQID